MKLYILIFIACGALGCFNGTLNYRGYFLPENERDSPFDLFTLANIYGFKNMTTNSTAGTWLEDG